MKSNKYLFIIVMIVLANTILFSGCEEVENLDEKELKNPTTLKDIAFDVNEKHGYTVHIEENEELVPYLVLTADYNGQALLLRKELLAEPHTFNDDAYGYSGYYKDSSIDKFLNEDFFATIVSKVQTSIVDSQITITSKSSLGVTGTDTEDIVRKVFLLSYTEIGLYDGSGVANIEGKSLKYFENPNMRIAYDDKGANSWWLRTSETWGDNTAIGIGPKGTNGGGSVDSDNGIRPAFCLNSSTMIEKKNETLLVIK